MTKKPTIYIWRLTWSPTGQFIGTVRASALTGTEQIAETVPQVSRGDYRGETIMKWNIGMTPLQQMIARVRNAHAMAAPGSVEHVTMATFGDSTWGSNWRVNSTQNSYRRLTTLDDLHPWERDLVTNGEPFARPSNRVRS